MAQRKLFILEVMNFILLVYRAVCIDQLVAVLVERQLGNDTVHFSSAHNVISCNTDDKVTYLVDDKKCVSNQELLNGCMFTIASVGSVTSHDMIAVYIESHQNNSITLMTADKNSSSVGIITYRKQYREVNNSLDCHVDSLEVYRGKKKVIKIRHGGFSIDENESIEIDQAVVAYSIDEFRGELYRMNVTCSDERGCLFFKVIGKSNITQAKFGGIVSGTVQTPNIEKTNESDSLKSFTIIDIVTYSISAVAGFLILMFIVVLMCIACCCCCTRAKAYKRSKRKNQTATAIPSKLKRELDLSYLVSDVHSTKEAASSERPSLSGY